MTSVRVTVDETDRFDVREGVTVPYRPVVIVMSNETAERLEELSATIFERLSAEMRDRLTILCDENGWPLEMLLAGGTVTSLLSEVE